MGELFGFAQLGRDKSENLRSILNAVQLSNYVDVKVDVIEFPDKIRIVLNVWLDGGLFTFEPVLVWDDERFGYCGLSKYIDDVSASNIGNMPELKEWLSAQLQKSFM